MDVLGRYRNLVVLVGVLFAQVLGLAVQVKRPTESGSTHLIRIWAVRAVTPLEKALVWTQSSTGNVWHNYLYLRGVRAENRALKQEIERMRLEEARMTQDADQAHRLQALLAFKEQFISQTLAAQVIGSTGSELSRSVYIDKGSHDGVKRDMAVITKDGIVGKVLYVYPSTSLVLLIDDQTSGVGVILEKERLQGILRGTASGEVVLEKVMSDEIVAVGEKVLTSGGDGIFPKGLPVGRVTKVSPGSELFFNIQVRPAVNLSRLEEVLVVTKIDERQAQPDQAGPMRAADILAERLPTVPPKPENAGDVAVKSPAAPAGGTASAATPKSTPANAASPAAEGKPKPAAGAATTGTKPPPTGAAAANTKQKPATSAVPPNTGAIPATSAASGNMPGAGISKSATGAANSAQHTAPPTAESKLKPATGAASAGAPSAGKAQTPGVSSSAVPIVKENTPTGTSASGVSPTGVSPTPARAEQSPASTQPAGPAKKPAPKPAATAVPPNSQPATQDPPQ